jgi:hypothetical protein
MTKKAIAIWALTSITFVSLVHLIEAITVIMFNNPIRLLQLYPFMSQALNSITPYVYFYISAITTAILWGTTCLIAFRSPVEKYINQQKLEETQIQDKSELLDRMCETVETDHQTLTRLTDIMRKMQKGVDGEQTLPITLSAPAETMHLKNKPSQAKTLTTKPTKTTLKPQKTGLSRIKQKIANKKKNENQKTKLNKHNSISSVQKIR